MAEQVNFDFVDVFPAPRTVLPPRNFRIRVNSQFLPRPPPPLPSFAPQTPPPTLRPATSSPLTPPAISTGKTTVDTLYKQFIRKFPKCANSPSELAAALAAVGHKRKSPDSPTTTAATSSTPSTSSSAAAATTEPYPLFSRLTKYLRPSQLATAKPVYDILTKACDTNGCVTTKVFTRVPVCDLLVSALNLSGKCGSCVTNPAAAKGAVFGIFDQQQVLLSPFFDLETAIQTGGLKTVKPLYKPRRDVPKVPVVPAPPVTKTTTTRHSSNLPPAPPVPPKPVRPSRLGINPADIPAVVEKSGLRGNLQASYDFQQRKRRALQRLAALPSAPPSDNKPAESLGTIVNRATVLRRHPTLPDASSGY